MVRLVTTKPILSALEAIPPSSREDLNLPETVTVGDPITHDQVIRISRYFREKRTADHDEEGRSLDSLLRGTRIYVPPPPPKPEPSPEYLALKARLLAAAEADAYKQMISPNHSASAPSPSIFSSSTPTLAALHDAKSHGSADADPTDPLTPSLVLNIFLSVLITGFSVYWALTYFSTPDILVSRVLSLWQTSAAHRTSGARGGAGASEAVRVLVSLFAALAVGVAEVLIYAIYLGKIEQARSKEKRLKERKVVVGREEVGRSSPAPLLVGEEGEKNEDIIWGRGPNGGLRRRVRERWEDGVVKKEKDEAG